MVGKGSTGINAHIVLYVHIAASLTEVLYCVVVTPSSGQVERGAAGLYKNSMLVPFLMEDAIIIPSFFITHSVSPPYLFLSPNLHLPYLVLGIKVGSLFTEEPHDGVVPSDSCHMEGGLSLLVHDVQKTTSLYQTLDHALVTMPTATEKGRVSFLYTCIA